jgi:putative transposase
VVSPQAKREAVTHLIVTHQFGVTRSCGLIGISRSLYQYESKRPDDAPLKERLTELAGQKRRYGYRRLHVLLRREGWLLNWKRTYRVYRKAGLMVRRRKRKRTVGIELLLKVIATGPNQSWSMDFVSDGFVDGRRLRCLNIVDDFTRECLAIEVDTSLPGRRVVSVLERLAEFRGLPQSVTFDNGPEFISKALDEWAYREQLQLRFIEPAKPQQNCYVESFNGKFRDECLNEHWFLSMRHAREVIATWRQEYNEERPHSSLDAQTLKEFAERFLTADSRLVSD